MSPRLAIALALVFCGQSAGQPNAAQPAAAIEPPAAAAVLRVSKDLVADLTDRTFARRRQIDRCLFGSHVTGEAVTQGTFTIEFAEAAGASAFYLQLQGETRTETVSSSRPVQVFSRGRLTFTARKRIAFDGTKFAGGPTTVDVAYESHIDGVAVPRGLRGRIARAVAMPRIRENRPAGAQIAIDEGRASLSAALDEEAAKVIARLNQVAPLEEMLNVAFPATRAWEYGFVTGKDHLVVTVAPNVAAAVVLPRQDKALAPLEFWFRGLPRDAALPRAVEKWTRLHGALADFLATPAGQATQRLAPSLPARPPVQPTVLGDWLVIRFERELINPTPLAPPGKPAAPGSVGGAR